MKINRRIFMGNSVIAASTLAAPTVFADGHAKPRVVVVGGGAGGAAVAATAVAAIIVVVAIALSLIHI